MIFAIVFLALLLALILGYVVVDERRRRRADRDRPATLEGGGSHLTHRKGK